MGRQLKLFLLFLTEVHGWGEKVGISGELGEVFMYLLIETRPFYNDSRFVFSHFSLRANVFLIK